MAQNCKVVHQPEKTREKSELNRLFYLVMRQLCNLLVQTSFFIIFEPFRGSPAGTLMLKRGISFQSITFKISEVGEPLW